MSETANQQIGRIGEALRRHDEYLKESEEANEIAHGFVESVRAVLCPTTAPQPRPSSPSDLAHRREAAAWRTELIAAQEHAANMERVASELRAAQVASKERVREVVRSTICSVIGGSIGDHGSARLVGVDVDVIADRAAEQLAAPAVLSKEDRRILTILHTSPSRTTECERDTLGRLLGAKP